VVVFKYIKSMATSLVNNKYRITRRIGGGSFGEIYMGIGPSGEKVGYFVLSFQILVRCLTNSDNFFFVFVYIVSTIIISIGCCQV